MSDLGGTYRLGDREVRRVGYGAMQLAGAGVMGPPKDPAEAARVLRAAIEAGVNHIDTSDFYGPYVTNQLIRETLHPYPEDLVIVTKVGFLRGRGGSWLQARSADQITTAVESNLRNLGVEALDVVNLRVGGSHGPEAGSIADAFEVLGQLKVDGKIRQLGLSNITAEQLEEGLEIDDVVCVQNNYGVMNRGDDALVDLCAEKGIAFVPFFPLGGFTPSGSPGFKGEALDAVAAEVGATAMQVALAWLLQRSGNILLIPGTSKVGHLEENLGAAGVRLTGEQVGRLDGYRRQARTK